MIGKQKRIVMKAPLAKQSTAGGHCSGISLVESVRLDWFAGINGPPSDAHFSDLTETRQHNESDNLNRKK